MSMQSLLNALGQQIEDPEEESFLLFSQSIPSQNLGFVDAKANIVDISIGNRDLSIHQSPTILSSNRGGGTTGAVVWKITPLFASWATLPSNLLFKHGVLSSSSVVLELGCGVSGIIGLALSPLIKSYTLTDQNYVLKLLNQNISENEYAPSSAGKGRRSANKVTRGNVSGNMAKPANKIGFRDLDWEVDEVTTFLTMSDSDRSFDLIIACDCIYNDALIEPLVQTCVDACRLRQSDPSFNSDMPTICIVAQQLRSSEVFEGWLKAFHAAFHVWRIPDDHLMDGLKSNSGFVVHIGTLR